MGSSLKVTSGCNSSKMKNDARENVKPKRGELLTSIAKRCKTAFDGTKTSVSKPNYLKITDMGNSSDRATGATRQK